MKRIISLFLALVMCFAMAACSAEDDGGEKKKDKEKIEDTKKEEETENTEPSEEYLAAVALLGEGKVKEAYTALYAIRDEANAKALMEKFAVVHTKEEHESGAEYRYEYTDKGLKAKESIYYDGRLESSCIYSYDDEGRCIKETTSFNGQGTKQYIYHEYNSDGLLSKSKMEYGGSVSEIEYVYGGDGNCVKQISRDPSGGEYVTEIEYDKQGNPEKEVMTSGGAVSATITYEYNGDGKLVKKTAENVRYGTSDVFEITYNTDGRQAVETYISGGAERYDTVNFYNAEHGGLTSVEKHYPDGRKEKSIDYSGFEFYYVG